MLCENGVACQANHAAEKIGLGGGNLRGRSYNAWHAKAKPR